jgi:hypothetical protein
MKRMFKNKIRETIKNYVKPEHLEDCVDGIYSIFSEYVSEVGLIRALITIRNLRNLYNKLFKI